MSTHSEKSTRQTVLVVPNIHCGTCATFIDDFLPRIYPKLISVATSIVSRSVTVNHDASLTGSMMAKALDKAAYVVESIIPNTIPDDPSSIESAEWRVKSRGSRALSLLNDMLHWARKKKTSSADAKEKRHLQHCERCRDQSLDSAPGGSDGRRSAATLSSSAVPVDHAREGVDSRPSDIHDVFLASLSITGMSCSSCIGPITDALKSQPWVKSVSVALITQSASVEFFDEANAAKLVEIIDDIGFEATLEDIKKVAGNADTSPNVWRAIYSIEGMTCSSCVAAITETVQSLQCVLSVDVNLVNGSATIVFEGKDNADDIAAAIEDIGYGASLIETVPNYDGRSAEGHDARRTVLIRIDGLHCEVCPGRVADAMEAFGGRVAVDKAATLEDPVTSISYTPDAPNFTIRAIISAISAADPAFKPKIHHPPTIEERAQQMRVRVQRRLLYRVLLSLIVAVPTFVIGIVYMALVPASNSARRYLEEPLRGVSRVQWALFVMATPVYIFAADVFHRRTIAQLRTMWKRGSPIPVLQRFTRFGSMDTLISFGTTIAYISSIAEIAISATLPRNSIKESSPTYFDSVVFLTMFLLIGRFIEAYSKAKTVDAVSSLQNLRPTEALLVLPKAHGEGDDRLETVDVDMVDTSDVARVVHGSSPPWDGILLEGEAVFDESSLTGESKSVKKVVGDTIYSGTINKGGPVMMRITGASGDSMLDQIIKVVREGQARRAPIEKIADILTSYFVPAITLVAIVTWFIWLGLGLSGTLPRDYRDTQIGGWPFWSLQFAIAVFIVACPCGIGLAAPTALFVGGGLAAKHGILVNGGGEAFQEASRLDIVVFDKTGTLTQGGDPRVTDHQSLQPIDALWDEQAILAALRELEQSSSHPLGKAVVGFCQVESARSAKGNRIEEFAGKGMKGSFDVDGTTRAVELLAGTEVLMADHGVLLDRPVSTALDVWKSQAKSVVVVAARTVPTHGEGRWTPVFALAVSDAIRPESRSVVQSLSREGLEVWMISGDNPTTANAVDAIVGIPEERTIAGVLPQEKAEKIKDLQQRQMTPKSRSLWGGRASRRAIVAMVGDGINDSPAMVVADVGVAVGSGSDVAISSADFVLLNSSMTTLLTLVRLSRTVFQRVKFNFGWALIYNALALPIAAGALYPVRSNGTHIRLDPVWASLAMALSSISVICSSLLLRSTLPFLGFRAESNRQSATA